MSVDRSLHAERLLLRIRASAEPAPGVDRRVLDGVERRIALEAAIGGGGGAGATGVSAVVRGTLRSSGAGPLAARLARWSAVGLLAGAVGYQLGWSAHEREVSGGRATSGVAAPGRTDATMAATTRAPEARPPAPLAPHLPPPDATRDDAPAGISPADAPSAPAPSAGASPAGALPAGASPDADATSAPASPPRATRSRERSARHAAPPSRAPSASFELPHVLEHLQRGHARLRQGDPHATLDILDALDARERRGLLADERLVLRALALCDIGRVGEARHVLAELDALGAGAIYRGRLEQSCAAALAP